MSQINKSWEKRLSGKPDQLTVDFVESLSYDKRLYKYDIAGSLAHAQMLSEQKLITRDELKKITDGLLEIEKEIESGEFKFDPTYEDIHMAIEAALISKAGDAGKKLHTGRSRNDQVATDIRLWMRDEISTIQGLIRQLQKDLVDLSEANQDGIMPAYTHLQRAQPVSIAAYLLSFVEQFERDVKRLGNCKQLLNINPLGSGAIAGSTLKLDRQSTTDKLGFSGFTYNSIDAVSDRDFAAEFIFDCALAGTHLSRLAEDWVLFSSNEFGFINIADAFCTSSSMMPQKKNPDVLELVRGKTGSLYGSLIAMLTILKGLPGGYNRDLQEDKIHIFNAADTLSKSLAIVTAITQNTKFNIHKIASGLDGGFLDATALAEYLVNKGLPFREAHGLVGQIVAEAEKAGKSLRSISISDLQRFSPKIGYDVFEHLGAANVAGKYVTEGSAGLEQAKAQIGYWKKKLSEK